MVRRSPSFLRVCYASGALAAAGVVGLAAGAPARSTARRGMTAETPDAAAGLRWSAPRRVLAGPTILFRSPSLAVTGSAAYVAAGPPLENTGRDRQAGEGDGGNLVLARVGGSPPGRPAGDFVFVHPRAALDVDGTLHLVWAEPADRTAWDTASERRAVRLGSLWHSRLRRGEWSAPAKIYEAAWISWEPTATSALVAAPSGALHFAFPFEDRSGGMGIAHLRLDGTRWRKAELRTRGRPVYADLAAGPGTRVVVAYVAGYQDGTGSHENVLFAVRSADGGGTWGAPHVVGGPSHWPASEPRLVVDRAGGLHMVWTGHLPGEMAGQAIWHAASGDGGATWNRFARLPFAGVSSYNQAVVDRRGAVHLVFTAYRNRRADLYGATYNRAGWTAAVPLFSARMGAQPSMRIDRGGGRVHLAWVAQPEGVPVPTQRGAPLPWFEIAYATADVVTP